MSSTREIKERIGSIQNTLKITNAMYLISSTKLNNAKASLAATEPYFLALESMFARVLRHLPSDFRHPFLDDREAVQTESARRAIICVTADKGLAGAYNHNVLKLTMDQFRPDSNDRLFVIGEVGRAWFAHRGVNVDDRFHYTAQKPTLDKSRQIAAIMLDLFTTGQIDEVYINYTRMKNSMETETQIVQLLPLVRLNSQIFAQPVGAGLPVRLHLQRPGGVLLLGAQLPHAGHGFCKQGRPEAPLPAPDRIQPGETGSHHPGNHGGGSRRPGAQGAA